MKQTMLISLLLAANLYTAEADTYDRSWRYDTMGIPRLATAPTIDATVGGDEWARATLFPPTIVMDPDKGAGLPMRKRTSIWMGYTADSLFVAMRQELPAEHLPLEVSITNLRDKCEGPDNTINLWIASDTNKETQYQIAFNAASQTYDRRVDDPIWTRWNPTIEFKSRLTDVGWEGEVRIPFAELGLKEAPADGTAWKCKLYSFWRKHENILSSWPYVRWWGDKGEIGTIVFAGNVPGIRFEQPGAIKLAGGEATVQTQMFRRKERALHSYLKQVDSSVQASTGEGATFESFEKIVREALAPFEPAKQIDQPGEYLLHYEVKRGDVKLATGIAPIYKPAPLELDITPLFLQAHKVIIEAAVDSPAATRLEASIKPVGTTATATFKAQRAKVELATRDWKPGTYEFTATAKDAQQKVVATTTAKIVLPEAPDWWTMKEGFKPRVPEPWTPVKAAAKKAEILGRVYDFDAVAVPAQVETRGQKILAAPMEFRTTQPWEKTSLKLVKKDDEAAVYESESVAGKVTLKVRTQVEFDGFMYVDVDITGDGNVDKLDFVIPFKKEHATLMQNYCKTAGPGEYLWKNPNDTNNIYKAGRRFVGFVPDYTLQTPPMLTTWIGTDHYGLELSTESSQGWAMAKPNTAMEVSRDGDKVLLTCHLISKPVALSKDKPRRIRFGLIATPSKTLAPYLQRARYNDNIQYIHSTFTRYPFWHEPLRDPKVIALNKHEITASHKAGAKHLFHGGWNVSTQTSDWDTWGKEMIAEPVRNVSFADAKQFGACWRSPFAEMLVNSFGFNAKLVGVDGVRFDTVVPPYECQNPAHDCGWRDDDGNLWPTMPIFAQREAFKRLYRIFHGGVIKEGVVYNPNAAGPIMAVDSFSDMREIGEGYYMKSLTLKDAYPPDMVRATMNSEAFGLRAINNLKGEPLLVNHRMTALLVHGMEGRMGDYRSWRPGYEGHGNTAVCIWDAWDWVDRNQASFIGYWETGDRVKVDAGTNMTMASCWLNKAQGKLLLVVGNYEQTPQDDLTVKLDLTKLGLKGSVYGEDAITSEPVPISTDGTLKLDVFGERYRLVKISSEKPRFRNETLAQNLVSNAPAEIGKSWQSADIKLDPGSTYVVRALLKFDKHQSEPPRIDNYVSFRLLGEGVRGVVGTNASALARLDGGQKEATYAPYAETSHYRQNSIPHLWEKTPGWYSVFVPFVTSTNTLSGKVDIGFVGSAQGVVKDVSLQKVKP